MPTDGSGGGAVSDRTSLPGLLEEALGHHRGGRLEQAVTCYRRALDVEPELAQVHLNLGAALKALGRYEDAEAHCARAVELRPDYAEAHYNLANVRRARGRLAAAAAAYRRAIAIRPAYPEARNNLGAVLFDMGHVEDAIAEYRHALELDADFVDALNNLGNALQRQGRLDEAETILGRAVADAPDRVELRLNLGSLLQAEGRMEEAMACYDRVVAMRPDWVEGRLKRAMALLGEGRFAAGWRDYEWRWRSAADGARANVPRWTGEPLDGRRILLRGEQGFGDTIQFARYVPLAAAKGGSVVVECERSLSRLLSSLDGAEAVSVVGETGPRSAVEAPLMSLPALFGTTLETIPGTVPYLSADAGRADAWTERLAGAAGFKVGLAWAGNPRHANDHNRSLAAAELAPLLATVGVSFYGLQVGERSLDAAALASGPFRDLSPFIRDFADTAAIVANLDLVISVDSAVAHLAGALARPVWILLPFDAEWRWLRDRDDSPWYPTARLFRQTAPGDWTGLIGRVGRALPAATR